MIKGEEKKIKNQVSLKSKQEQIIAFETMKQKEIQEFNLKLDFIIEIKTDLDEITTYIHQNTALQAIEKGYNQADVTKIPNKNINDINKLISDIYQK